MTEQPKMTYLRLPPSKWIFKFPRMQDWIYEKVKEVSIDGDVELSTVLNLFAGETMLSDLLEYRVDINKEIIADWYGDAYNFIGDYYKHLKLKQTLPFKVALLDPPYNVRKAREKFEGRYIGSFTKIKNKLSNILTKNSRVITWGYSSVGMSKSRGYKLSEVLLICHSGDHNDTIVTVEDRI